MFVGVDRLLVLSVALEVCVLMRDAVPVTRRGINPWIDLSSFLWGYLFISMKRISK